MKKMTTDAQRKTNGGAWKCKTCGRTFWTWAEGVWHVMWSDKCKGRWW